MSVRPSRLDLPGALCAISFLRVLGEHDTRLRGACQVIFIIPTICVNVSGPVSEGSLGPGKLVEHGHNAVRLTAK